MSHRGNRAHANCVCDDHGDYEELHGLEIRYECQFGQDGGEIQLLKRSDESLLNQDQGLARGDRWGLDSTVPVGASYVRKLDGRGHDLDELWAVRLGRMVLLATPLSVMVAGLGWETWYVDVQR